MTFSELCEKMSAAQSFEEYDRLREDNDYWGQYYKLKAEIIAEESPLFRVGIVCGNS